MKDQIIKDALLKILIDDFVREFPDSKRNERVELYTRLNMFSIEDLKLLASQIEVRDHVRQGEIHEP